MVGDKRRLRLLGGLASALLVGLAVILAIVGGEDGEGTPTGTAAHIAAADEPAALEGSLGHPVYWAGERPPARIELSGEAGGSVYLRYLPPGVGAGDPRPEFLTVGTYPVADAQAAIRAAAREAGASVSRLPDGRVLLANPASKGSVYVAYPDSDLQIEVFDPTPGRALELIRSGAIRPVGEG